MHPEVPAGGLRVGAGNYCNYPAVHAGVRVADKIRNDRRKRYCYCLNTSPGSLGTRARPAGAVGAGPLLSSFSFALPPATLYS